jgi:glycosyltransferase involved in cell wall biosynthesis
MPQSQVSVVVSTYTVERADYVLSCIESLRRQTMPPEEIVLVLDPNEALVEFYKSHLPDGVRIIVSRGYGLSLARNAGVDSSHEEIVAFIDDDAIAEGSWLENFVRNYETQSVLGVGGLVKPVWKSGRPKWFPEELDWIVGCSYRGLPTGKTSTTRPLGCNFSFRRSVFKDVGYFHTDVGRFGSDLLQSEETEFSVRALSKKPNGKIVYDPSSVVYHIVPAQRTRVSYAMKRAFYQGISKAIMRRILGSAPLSIFSAERSYFAYLLGVSIPSRLKKINSFQNLLHIFVLCAVIGLVAMGFVLGSLRKTGSSL